MKPGVFVRTAWAEARYQLRILASEPGRLLVLVAPPLVILPLAHAINRHVFEVIGRRLAGDIQPGVRPGRAFVGFGAYLTPALAALGVAGACMCGLALHIVTAREDAILNRIRTTPISRGGYIAGHIAAYVVVAFVVAAATFAVGVAFFDATVVMRLLPAAVVTLFVGAACFIALGLACAGLVTTRDSVIAGTFGPLLVLGLMSSILVVPLGSPPWMHDVASNLPLEPFARALYADVNPGTRGSGFEWGSLAKLVGWGAGSALVASVSFSWEPLLRRSSPPL